MSPIIFYSLSSFIESNIDLNQSVIVIDPINLIDNTTLSPPPRTLNKRKREKDNVKYFNKKSCNEMPKCFDCYKQYNHFGINYQVSILEIEKKSKIDKEEINKKKYGYTKKVFKPYTVNQIQELETIVYKKYKRMFDNMLKFILNKH